MKFDPDIAEISLNAAEWRKDLHRHPQTSFEETYCRDFVCSKLEEFGIHFETGLAGTGVVGTIRGKKDSGRAVAFRADMDALDIEEENDFAHASENPGKMHACGHDGHTAMLLAAAKCLASRADFEGKVHVVFQPAEENGAGGEKMILDGLFEKFPAESVWGMHNLPSVPVGAFGTRAGAIMAATSDFDARLVGSGGHAAMPHGTRDPVVGAASIIGLIQTIVSRNVNPVETGLISVTGVNAGTAYNIIPDEAGFYGTVRSLSDEGRKLLEDRLEAIVRGGGESLGLKTEVKWSEDPYPAVVNSAAETEIARRTLVDAFGPASFIGDFPPVMGGEDFAFMLLKRPGCFIFTGNGVEGGKGGHGLHTSRYDFNDDAIPFGVTYWVKLASALLPPA